jgi:hypothetical protein
MPVRQEKNVHAMKMSYPELKHKPKTFQSLTGLNPKEFEGLLNSFGEVWAAYIEETFHRKDRQRGYGAGRKAELKHLEDKLLFIHSGVFPTVPDSRSSGIFFGIGQAQANEWAGKPHTFLRRYLETH